MKLISMTARCVGCGHIAELDAPLIDDVPMCPKCFSPMCVTKVEAAAHPKGPK